MSKGSSDIGAHLRAAMREPNESAGGLQTSGIGRASRKANGTSLIAIASARSQFPFTLPRSKHLRAGVVTQKRWILSATALIVVTVLAADRRASLLDLKVSGMQQVAPARYSEASAVASRGGTPVDIALAVVGPFEGATQHIVQANEGSEAPTRSRLTVLRDGLLDDSVRGERWEIALERNAEGRWLIRDVQRAWRCRRGGQTDRFAAAKCP